MSATNYNNTWDLTAVAVFPSQRTTWFDEAPDDHLTLRPSCWIITPDLTSGQENPHTYCNTQSISVFKNRVST
jgi:hypothetical protein